MDATGYIDESGHSGANYLDAQQPVFVVAAALVPVDAEAEVAKAIAEVDRHYPGTKEVKASTLVKSPKGRRLLATAVGSMGKAGLTPVFQIWQKRYCVAAKLIETFFDPAYNSACRLDTAANEDRQELAELLLEKLSPACLDEFFEAYREPTEERFRASITKVATELDAIGQRDFAAQVRGNLENVRELAEDEAAEDLEVGFRHSVQVSLNLPAFFDMVTSIDGLAFGAGHSVDLIHDETVEYAGAFQRTFEQLSKQKRGYGPVLQNGRRFIYGISAIRSFKFGRSHEVVGLRAADFLATGIRALVHAELKLINSCPHLDVLARQLMPMLLLMPEGARVVGSKKFMSAVLDPVARELRDFAKQNPAMP